MADDTFEGEEASAGEADGAQEWDRARASLVASQPGSMAQAVAQGIARWQELSASPRFTFSDYSGFILTHPGFPDEAKLRTYAEAQLFDDYIDPARLVAFFDRYPPLTNAARAQYALALDATGRSDAAEMARAAWRGGGMSETAEASILARFGGAFSAQDHDERMDALLWERNAPAARRLLASTSEALRGTFIVRIAAAEGFDPEALELLPGPEAGSDPGYLYNVARQLRKAGRKQNAANLLANRPALASRPHDAEGWIEENLVVARAGGARAAQRIAASAHDAFDPGADISRMSYDLRDNYTSLMWLGGTSALWELGEPASAAPLFYRYGTAARTPQTRAKGFYWAGLAADRAGDAASATSYFEQAAQYPERFYGLLALERLGRPMPAFQPAPTAQPTTEERAAFTNRPLTAAVREVARDAPWATGIRFYREIAAQAQSEADHVLVVELAREIGRRDLAVILGEAAGEHGLHNFSETAFPTVSTPPATDWTMIHAITRQESQFAQNAMSHAGARGLMQLMPGTAREQAGKLGMSYMSASLMDDASYNIRLGEGYIRRMIDYYGGSYPLAVAAYNAGPGNVNKWLRANGDPRTGSIGWAEWIERIPLSETRNYVQRVLENAVVYEAMHPDKATHGHSHSMGGFLTINLDG